MGCSSRQLIPPIDVSITPCVDCGKDIKPSEINDKLYIRLRSEYERKSKEHACGENDSRYAKNSSLASLILHIGSSIIQPKSIPVFDYQVKDATCVAEPTLEQSLTPWTILNTKEPIYLSWKFARQNKDSIDLNKIRGDVSEVAKFIGSAGVKEAVAVSAFVDAKPFQDAVNGLNGYIEKNTDTKIVNLSSNIKGTVVNIDRTKPPLNEANIDLIEEIKDYPWSDPLRNPLGHMRIYPEVTNTLLFRQDQKNFPEVKSVRIDTVLNKQFIDKNADPKSLKDVLRNGCSKLSSAKELNFSPNWERFDDVNESCINLENRLNECGLNLYDRAGLLYLYLSSYTSKDKYNTKLTWNEISKNVQEGKKYSSKILTQYKKDNFPSCLKDTKYYATMKEMSLPVVSDEEYEKAIKDAQNAEIAVAPKIIIRNAEIFRNIVLTPTTPQDKANQLDEFVETGHYPAYPDIVVVVNNKFFASTDIEKLIPLVSKNGSMEDLFLDKSKFGYFINSLPIQELGCIKKSIDSNKAQYLFSVKSGFKPNIGIMDVVFEPDGKTINQISLSPTFFDNEYLSSLNTDKSNLGTECNLLLGKAM